MFSKLFFAFALALVVAIAVPSSMAKQTKAIENELKEAICKNSRFSYLKRDDCFTMAQFIIEGDIDGFQKYLKEFKQRVAKKAAQQRQKCMELVGVRAVCLGFTSWSHAFDQKMLWADR